MPAEKLGADHEQESAYQMMAVSDLQVGDVIKNRGEITAIVESQLNPNWLIVKHTGGVMTVSKGAHIWARKAEH